MTAGCSQQDDAMAPLSPSPVPEPEAGEGPSGMSDRNSHAGRELGEPVGAELLTPPVPAHLLCNKNPLSELGSQVCFLGPKKLFGFSPNPSCRRCSAAGRGFSLIIRGACRSPSSLC